MHTMLGRSSRTIGEGRAYKSGGNWEFYGNTFNFPQWNSNARCCFLCQASNTLDHLLWTDFTKEAGWRGTIWSHSSYIKFLRDAGASVPVLLTDVIGLTLTCIHVDVLHTVDQGFASHMLANVFIECMHPWASNKEARAEKLNSRIKEWFKRHRDDSKMEGKLMIERLRTKAGWPKLRAKAATTRHLYRIALELARESNSGSKHDRFRSNICELLVRFYDILNYPDQFFEAPILGELASLGVDLCRLYAVLS